VDLAAPETQEARSRRSDRNRSGIDKMMMLRPAVQQACGDAGAEARQFAGAARALGAKIEVIVD
jgi:hypothetical protein